MNGTSAVATGVLGSCLVITWLLSKANMFGILTITGFALGALAVAALFVLVS
ncbi:MAG TPA: hypothetical protein VGR06_20360 [Actinophytocola sp.]|jgi:hypothetical protein|uniref:hypothetical protein n=1 Tax=Actinophytocola sp. TaxID=1872138 RepID=UPI002E0407D1|nr:hypothetical protein [Actinophytocola sp.]